jgi:hypothetical protein
VQASPSQFAGCKPQLFLNKMQPYLSLAQGSPGYALGAAAAASNASGLVWSQGVAALMSQSSGASAQLQVQAGPLVLPGGVSLQVSAWCRACFQHSCGLPGNHRRCRLTGRNLCVQVRGLPPASVSVIVRNPSLVPDDNALEGRTLSLAYQLRDAANRWATGCCARAAHAGPPVASGA